MFNNVLYDSSSVHIGECHPFKSVKCNLSQELTCLSSNAFLTLQPVLQCLALKQCHIYPLKQISVIDTHLSRTRPFNAFDAYHFMSHTHDSR